MQRSLHIASDKLRRNGVFYPRFGHKSSAHHLLLPLCGNPLRLPAWSLEDLGGPDGARQSARVAWEETCLSIRQNRPDLLVLSSEFMTYRTDEHEKAHLFDLLSALSDDITPILYIRNPVDHYRSRLQQWLKQLNRPLPPTRLPLREAILADEAVFPNPLQLIAFDRATLHGGDIVQDFAKRFLSPWVGATDLPAIQVNVGLSAEALMLMVRLRAEGDNTDEVARRVARLIPFLEGFDRDHPPAQRLTLLPEVADAALRTSTCHRWLAETGRLRIPGLEVDRIDGAAVPDWLMTAPPETLFPHDPDRLDHLRQAFEQASSDSTRRKTLLGPQVKRPLRISELLLRFLRGQLASRDDRNTGAAPTRTQPDRRS